MYDFIGSVVNHFKSLVIPSNSDNDNISMNYKIVHNYLNKIEEDSTYLSITIERQRIEKFLDSPKYSIFVHYYIDGKVNGHYSIAENSESIGNVLEQCILSLGYLPEAPIILLPDVSRCVYISDTKKIIKHISRVIKSGHQKILIYNNKALLVKYTGGKNNSRILLTPYEIVITQVGLSEIYSLQLPVNRLKYRTIFVEDTNDDIFLDKVTNTAFHLLNSSDQYLRDYYEEHI